MKKVFLVLTLILISTMAWAIPDRNMSVSDTWPYYTGQMVGADGSAIDLSGTTITAYLVPVSLTPGATPTVNYVYCTKTSDANGTFEYRWTATDTATAGTYYIYFRATAGTLVWTVPQREKAKLIISAP